MTEVTAELRDWECDHNGIVFGNIHGDAKERWMDGTRIYTSSVEEIVEKEDHYIVYTLNSIYLLMKSHKRGQPATLVAPTQE